MNLYYLRKRSLKKYNPIISVFDEIDKKDN